MTDDERFEIRDRRRLDTEGNVKKEGEGAPGSPPETNTHKRPPEEEGRKKPAPPQPEGTHFVSFLMNLAAMAYAAMGIGEKTPVKPSLPEAKYLIDTIGMLEEKTRGNLAPEEETAIKTLLYELRMNFAKAASGQGSRGGPGH